MRYYHIIQLMSAHLCIIFINFSDHCRIVQCFTFTNQLLNVFIVLGGNYSMLNRWRQLTTHLLQIFQ